jgi:hypothetical protein
MTSRGSRSGLGCRLLPGIAVGIMATVAMDLAMVSVARIGGERWSSPRLGIDVIGRWGAGLLRGRLRHDDASGEAARTTDIVAGLATHYATGVALTEVFILAPWRPAGLFPAAIAYGVATAALPLFVLFPSLGYGALGLRSGDAARLTRIMLVGHVAFGIGIGLGATLVAGGQAPSRPIVPGDVSGA